MKITCKQLELLGIDYFILDKNTINYKKLIKKKLENSLSNNSPFAIVVRKNTFIKNKVISNFDIKSKLLSRENIIKEILKSIPKNTFIVSTTGFSSRELFEIRKIKKMNHAYDFLTIGGMGHASQIAVGIALAKPNLQILCIDGDGSLLMHSGSMALNALCTNLIHVVINNGVHDSVGGQATLAKNIRLSKLANSFGYGYFKTVENKTDISKSLKNAFKLKKSSFIEILSIKGVSSDLSRPNLKPTQIKELFMEELKKND